MKWFERLGFRLFVIFPEKFRWGWIRHINKKYKQACWGNLCSWAMYKEQDIEDWNEQMCRSNNLSTPYAYCGKCEQLGLYKL